MFSGYGKVGGVRDRERQTVLTIIKTTVVVWSLRILSCLGRKGHRGNGEIAVLGCVQLQRRGGGGGNRACVTPTGPKIVAP